MFCFLRRIVGADNKSVFVDRLKGLIAADGNVSAHEDKVVKFVDELMSAGADA